MPQLRLFRFVVQPVLPVLRNLPPEEAARVVGEGLRDLYEQRPYLLYFPAIVAPLAGVAAKEGVAVVAHPASQVELAVMVLVGFVCWWAYYLITAWMIRPIVRDQLQKGARCPLCGYDLRASPERCPECGAAAKGVAGRV